MEREINLQKQTARLEDSFEIEYYTAGEVKGKPVILLHGGGTDHAVLSWRDTIPALVEAGYRAYAPNYPGYGGSIPGSRPAIIENLVGYLERLMDSWGLQQAALIGISMGGSVAIGYTLRHPERVRRMILIGSYGIQDKAPYHVLSYFMVRMPWMMDALWAMTRGSRWAARYSLKSILHNPESRSDELVDEIFEAMQYLDSQKAFGQMQRDEILWKGLKTNYTDRLGEIQAPVLIVHGEQDIGVPLHYARRAAERFPNARLVVFEKAGHWTQRDYPEKFNKLMLEFLSEQD
jgi:pimeloyl-ACP methyl ester carboxylesterase